MGLRKSQGNVFDSLMNFFWRWVFWETSATFVFIYWRGM